MKKSKKIISLVISAILAVGCFSAVAAYADTSVAINEVNFPDANFRQFISDEYDADSDGALSSAERTGVSLMYVLSDGDIEDLTGIEYFPSVTKLYCDSLGVKTIDLSALTNLTYLYCPGNSISSLDLSANTRLETLICSDNELQTLVVKSPALTKLHCYANSIAELDLSACTLLTDLRCDQNELTDLEISANTQLTQLTCASNHLRELDLSKNTLLTDITNSMIGGQTVTLTAEPADGYINIPFSSHSLSTDDVTCTLADYGDGSGFEGNCFKAYDVSEIDGGFTYYANTRLTASESMEVNVTVERDFSQVEFYSDDTLATMLSKVFVANGGTASAPSIAAPDACKKLDSWSADITNVTQDLQVYPVWADNHTYALYSFSGDTATVKCKNCDSSFTLSYLAAVNSEKGDDNFSEYLDVTGDGFINAKDYSLLNKMSK